VYCVGAAEPAFGPWDYTSQDAGYKSGSGTMVLTVDFMPCTVEFRLYRNPAPYAYMATSNEVKWTGDFTSEPRHVRVAYGTKPQSEATVSWTSSDGTNPAILYAGTKSGHYDTVSSASAPLSYENSDLCSPSGGWFHPGYFHHALLAGLKPGTRYFVLPSQGGVNGTETSFVTGKPTGAFVPTRFAMYGDMLMSGGTGGVATVANVKARIDGPDDLDFVLHVGDISYGEGSVSTWNAWHAVASDITSRLPYMVSIGNHEYDYPKSADGSKDPSGVGEAYAPSWWNGGSDSNGECGVPTSRRFRTPANGNGVFWYSFEVGNVHVAMVSSEHDPNPGSPMGDWLEEDLLAVDRAITPWLILGIHRPLVETEAYPGDFAVAAGLRAILEPLLLRAKVDVVMSGHYHAFQRTCAMSGLKCVAEDSDDWGIVHYTSGAAGCGLDGASVYPSDYVVNTIEGRYGYSIVDAPNSTALGLFFYTNDDNEVADEHWITR
jgi:acid phosphatase type 7